MRSPSTDQNEVPTIASNGGGDTAAVSIAENATVATTVTATDPDAGQTLSYTIVGGADAAKFTLNPTTGALAFVAAPNFEAPADSGANNVYDVDVQVADGNGGIDTQAIAVTVTDQNEVPTITSNGGGDTAAEVDAENANGGTTVTAADPVAAGQTSSYAIVGGARRSQFTLNSTTGALAFATAPNFEAPGDSGTNNVYDVTVQASDGNGGIDTQAIAVTVNNQNEVPTITSNGGGDTAAASIAENTTVVTTVTTTDPDAGQTLSYAIVDGADAASSQSTGRLARSPSSRHRTSRHRPTRCRQTSTTLPSRSRTVAAGSTLKPLRSRFRTSPEPRSMGPISAETLTGTGEEDIINGLAGADTMSGGLGNDTYVVDNAGDVVTENANEGIDTVQAAVDLHARCQRREPDADRQRDINGTGNALDNVLTGNSGKQYAGRRRGCRHPHRRDGQRHLRGGQRPATW